MNPGLTPPTGRPMTAAEINRDVFHGARTVRWIHTHCPRHKLGRIVIFYEAEVVAWIADHIENAA